jgi:hypothetical protein
MSVACGAILADVLSRKGGICARPLRVGRGEPKRQDFALRGASAAGSPRIRFFALKCSADPWRIGHMEPEKQEFALRGASAAGFALKCSADP